MNLDQMMETWRSQDEAPLYGVNRDLLQLVLQHEQARIRRMLHMELWVACIVGAGAAIFAGAWLWMLIDARGGVLQTVAAGAGAGAFGLWLGAFWVSRSRQARRERGFGNSLQEEVTRNLSLVEYQLSIGGSLRSAMVWTAPPLVGGALIYWLIVEINLDPGESRWENAWMLIVFAAGMFLAYAGVPAARKKLERRRQRLAELLAMLNAGA